MGWRKGGRKRDTGPSCVARVSDLSSDWVNILVQKKHLTPYPIRFSHTMTTKILFEDIIKAIKHFLNFNPNIFPIVLSFENHCSIPYQEVMAEQLVRILGKSLYIPPDDSLFGLLPSPME